MIRVFDLEIYLPYLKYRSGKGVTAFSTQMRGIQGIGHKNSTIIIYSKWNRGYGRHNNQCKKCTTMHCVYLFNAVYTFCTTNSVVSND